jgi:hypothetical protein
MNIPFRFALNTSTNPIGRVYDYAGSDGWENQTLKTLAVIPGSPDGLGTVAATRLAAMCVLPPATTKNVAINGLSITSFNATDTQNPKVDIGLWDTVNSAFLPLYECVATSNPGGGIQKTFGAGESGLYVPIAQGISSNLFLAIRVTKQGATDGDVTIAGDISLTPM